MKQGYKLYLDAVTKSYLIEIVENDAEERSVANSQVCLTKLIEMAYADYYNRLLSAGCQIGYYESVGTPYRGAPRKIEAHNISGSLILIPQTDRVTYVYLRDVLVLHRDVIIFIPAEMQVAIARLKAPTTINNHRSNDHE